MSDTPASPDGIPAEPFHYTPSIIRRVYSAEADNYEVIADFHEPNPESEWKQRREVGSASVRIREVFHSQGSLYIQVNHLRAVAQMLIECADVLDAKGIRS